ncbi:hypothetical protein [Paenibacillus puerhi]|uniref:hypothetical protein n=1 Tax=Paenibacillus puerhi TaxID=2692622 RepID=UPI0013569101|nr:hypothetical protein [Paenibacillus puerhi]
MKKYARWLLTLLTIAVWAGNYVYYERHKLEEPVFLEHFYEFTPFAGDSIELFYVTHRDFPQKLFLVQPSEDVMWPVQGVSTYGDYGPYRIHQATVQLGQYEQPLPAESYQAFTELTMQFSEGGSLTAPVGRIALLPPAGEAGDPLLTMTMSRSSSDAEVENVMQARENLRVSSASHNLKTLLGDRLHVSVHKTMYEDQQVPFDLKQDEALSVEQRIDPAGPARTGSRMEAIQGELRLELQPAADPERTWSWSSQIRRYPEPDRRGIADLLERRGGGMSDGG